MRVKTVIGADIRRIDLTSTLGLTFNPHLD